MPGFLATLGMQAASTALGAGMGLALEPHADRRQIRQQERLQALEIRGQKEMSDYNYSKQMQLWHDTNYSAQMAELEKAGLNPGLLYGMGGGGGSSVSTQPGHISSTGNAPQGGREAIEGAAMGLQLQSQLAQIELAKSQADKNRADADATRGYKQQESQASADQSRATTASLMQGITNAKAQLEIQKAEAALKNMELKFQGETYEDRVDYIMYNTRIAMNSLDMAANEQYIQRATMNAKIDTIRTQAVTALITNAAMLQKIQLDKAQIQTWATQLAQGWQNLDQRQKEIRIQEFKANLEAKNPGIFNVLGGVLSGGLDEISDITTGRDQRYEQRRKVNP